MGKATAKPDGEDRSGHLRAGGTWTGPESATSLSGKVAEIGRGLLSLGCDRRMSASLFEYQGETSRTITVEIGGRDHGHRDA